jgi:hypothetical protein
MILLSSSSKPSRSTTSTTPSRPRTRLSVAGRLGSGLAPAPTLEQPGLRWALGELLLEHQVGLGDDPGQAPFPVQDRQGADPVLDEQPGDLPEGGMLVHGDDVLGHDSSYAAPHGISSPPDRGPI